MKERLREYINKDYSYNNYKSGIKLEEMSDFDRFCIQHCKDIEDLLNENEVQSAKISLLNCTKQEYYEKMCELLKEKNNND